MFQKGAWLGQVPLILGPSSWAAIKPTFVYDPVGVPPYWGEWGFLSGFPDGRIAASGRVGPFDTIEEAFRAAAEAASKAGARHMPLDGYAQVKDSRGAGVGPIT